MQITSTSKVPQPVAAPPAAKPNLDQTSELDSILDRIDVAGDRVVSDMHLKNAWRGVGVAATGAVVGVTGAALALTASGSVPGQVAGGLIAIVGSAVSIAGICIADSAYIAARE